MRIFHLSILFAIIAVIFVTMQDISYEQMVVSKDETRRLEKEFTKAIDLGTEQLCYDGSGTVYKSIGTAYDSILESLYASFDLMMDPEGQQRLQLCLAVFALADEDGLYISYLEEKQDNPGYLTRVWTKRIPYSLQKDGITYYFSLSGTTTCIKDDKEEVIQAQGALQSLGSQTIADVIEQNMQNYISRHNRIARQYGISYQFQLPVEDGGYFGGRSIKNPSLILSFQGYPLHGTNQTYNNFTFSAASLKKKDHFVLTKQEGHFRYHRKDCKRIQESSSEGTPLIICHTPKECAEYGAFPCQDCIGW